MLPHFSVMRKIPKFSVENTLQGVLTSLSESWFIACWGPLGEKGTRATYGGEAAHSQSSIEDVLDCLDLCTS